MKYILSQETERVLADIEDYTAVRWSETQAETYIRKLYAAFEKLSDNPGLGRSRADVPAPFLVFSVGSHLVVYRYDVERQRIEVLTVLHPAMDLKRQMSNLLRRMQRE